MGWNNAGWVQENGWYRNKPAGGSLGLQTNLTGFWSLENTSWLDDTASGTTLTPVASPTTATGIVGNGVSINGSTQGLGATSNSNILSGAGDFSIQAWVNSSGNPFASSSLIFNKDGGTAGTREWGLGTIFTSSNVWTFICYNTSTTAFNANGTAAITTGWHHLVGTFNGSTNAMVFYVDGAVVGSGNTLTGTIQSTASAPLGIGQKGNGVSTTACTIDQCGFWKGRVLSAGDVTLLYNGGAGLTYAAMA